MKKAKGKLKDKNKKANKQLEIVINDVAETLTDCLKLRLWNRWEEFSQLEKELAPKEGGNEKFIRNLLRALEHNPCFVEKDGKWGVDKRGQELNDIVYQWLSTTKSPLSYKELQLMAEENGIKLGTEKDLVWDSRFIRLKSGRWGLSSWKIEAIPGRKELKALLKEIERAGAPLALEDASRFLNANLPLDKLSQILTESGLFVKLKPNLIFSKRVLDKLIEKLSKKDTLKLFRQAENNVLQEAELMLIIKDNTPGLKRCILSSWDLETGRLTLTKRLSKIFQALPEICFLNFKLNGQPKGLWYFARENVLYDLKDWYEENKLEPGTILELSWSKAGPFPDFTLSVSAEREAEVYSEGRRVLELASFCRKAKYEQLDLESTLFGIMEHFPAGLSLDYIRQALEAAEVNSDQLETLLNAYPFFEETSPGIWRCNLAMKESYFDFLNQIKHIQNELEAAKKEVASSLAEIINLQTERDNLHEELAYLQKVHREEQALYQQKLSELAVQAEHYQIENAKLKSELDRLKEQEKELLQEIHTQGEQIANLRKEKNKLKVRNEQLENKLIQVQGTLVKNLEEAEAEIIRLKKQLAENNSHLESLQYANKELQKSLARLHEERREMKRKLSLWPVRLILFFFDLGVTKSKAVSG